MLPYSTLLPVWELYASLPAWTGITSHFLMVSQCGLPSPSLGEALQTPSRSYSIEKLFFFFANLAQREPLYDLLLSILAEILGEPAMGLTILELLAFWKGYIIPARI